MQFKPHLARMGFFSGNDYFRIFNQSLQGSMQLSEIYMLFQQYPVVVTDTRKTLPNSIFFALKGENFNGNEFALSALEKKCEYAVIDEPEFALDNRFIVVDNVLKTLQELARMHRRKLGIPILAITGTNGKTTTKELINEVLQQKFRTVATQGNLNNHIGVPLTLLSMNKDNDFGIVEMGANHPGEIQFLCEIAEPDYGIITNVGKAHLEGFGSFEGVMKTKKELYDFLSQTKGKVFVNIDNSYLKKMLNEQEVIAYGTTDDAYSKAKFLQAEPYLVFELRSSIGKLYVKTKLIGAYNFENALAAATIGRYFGIDEVKIQTALEQYVPNNNRSQLKKTEKNVLFLDAYNANPSSMCVAIDNFAALPSTQKLVILGDMLELGNDSEKEHANLVNLLQEKQLENVFLVGTIFSDLSLPEHFVSFKTTTDLLAKLDEIKVSNYYILIKGSRGIRLEQVIEKL